MSNLTAMDVKKLTQEPSVKVRGLLASKIAMDYRAGNFSVVEENIAADIFRLLLKDVEVQIRQSLAEQLAHCSNVPRDIVLKLANDKAEVAMEVLEHSMVLTDADLISIVESTAEVIKLCAVARRGHLSAELSGSLIEKQQVPVMGTLFQNPGATLTERHIAAAWETISTSNDLMEKLVKRGGLPLTVAEKIFYAVSDELKQHMARQYKINAPFFHKALNDVREWEMLGLTPSQHGVSLRDDEQVDDLIEDLHTRGRLTHSLLIRALCVGNLNVFEAGIAKLSNVPRVNARILLLDRGGLGMQAIYRAAGMPEGFFEAVNVLLRLSLEETEFGRTHNSEFRKRVIDRIFIEKYNLTVENMGYLLSIIGGKIVTPADASV